MLNVPKKNTKEVQNEKTLGLRTGRSVGKKKKANRQKLLRMVLVPKKRCAKMNARVFFRTTNFYVNKQSVKNDRTMELETMKKRTPMKR